MDAVLEMLGAASVREDRELKAAPEWGLWRPAVGIAPRITDAELVTMAVLQALWASPPRPSGCISLVIGRGTCSPTCPSNRGTTRGYVHWWARELAGRITGPRHHGMDR